MKFGMQYLHFALTSRSLLVLREENICDAGSDQQLEIILIKGGLTVKGTLDWEIRGFFFPLPCHRREFSGATLTKVARV